MKLRKFIAITICEYLNEELKFENYLNNLNNNFWKWFGKSKVVNTDGSPMILYHGSGSHFNMFEKGDIGYHFGTKKAAISRLRSKKIYGNDRVFKSVYLKIENYLVIKDVKYFSAYPVTQELIKIGVFSKKDEYDVDDNWKKIKIQHGNNYDYDTVYKEHTQYVANLIIKKGYDGIKYINDFENKGSVSWVVFNANQIKSTQNDGSWDIEDKNIFS